MRNDGWVAGVAALAVLSGLTGGLIAMAIRPVHVPAVEPAAGPATVQAAPAPGAHAARPMLCVGSSIVCSAPQLPAGYPCSCMHPLHGTVGGRVSSIDDADEALTLSPGGARRLDPDDMFGP